MRIRTLNIHHAPEDTKQELEIKADGGAPINLLPPQSSRTQREFNRRHKGVLHYSSLRRSGWWTLCIVLVSLVVGSLPWSLALATVDFESLTFSQWAALFDSASASMQLPQLYLSAPRVRAKILVATSVTMAELLSGEAIFRHRISEIVEVAVERVIVEYIETTALQESARGLWALSLGISALVAPSTATLRSSETLVMSTVDMERRRILDRFLFGGMVRGLNVTVSSLQLFGTTMRLLSATLDGEAFYQIDTTPWIGLRLVLASSGATATAVSAASSSSASGAFQDLRLRFLLVRFLQRLKVDTSTILVRDAVMVDAAQPYGVPAMVLSIEIHIGEAASLRSAAEGYLRNTSLSTALRAIEPQWSLLAVEIDQDADVLQGNGTVDATNSTAAWTAPWRVAIDIRVDGLSIAHIQRRGPAILDATRTLLSQAINISTIALSFGPVSTVFNQQTTSAATGSTSTLFGSRFFSSGGGDDIDTAAFRPMDRGFVVQLHVTPVSETSVWTPDTFSAVGSAFTNATDVRPTLGVLEPFELSSTAYSKTRVQFLQTTTLQSERDSGSIGSSFVRIALTLRPRANVTAAAMDMFAEYRIRCALLLVLERVFVSDQDLVHVETVPLLDVAVRVEYLAQLTEETQRNGIERAVQSSRLRQAVEDDGSLFILVESKADLHADGSMPRSVVLPGTTSLLTVDPSSPASRIFPEPKETVYNFADPSPSQNPSVVTNVPTGCPSPSPLGLLSAPTFYGCLVLHWSSEFPARSMFVRTMSATNGVTVSSANIQLPSATPSTFQANPVTNVVAPWIPGELGGEEPIDWTLQFLSQTAQNVSISLALEFADASSRFYPAFKLSIELRLADTQAPSSRMQVVSLRRQAVSLVPLTWGSAPATIVQRASGLYTTGSRTDIPQSMFTANVSIGLAQQSWLGLVDSTSATAAWTAHQPACLACLSAINVCRQLDECVAITQCLQRTLDRRLLLYSELLQQSNAMFDLSDDVLSCLSSPNPRSVQWSSSGRAAMLTSLQCVFQSSCAMATSPVLGRRLSLRYAPRQQVIHVMASHFPLSLSFLLDVNGGMGASPDGATRTRTSGNLSEMSSSALTALHVLVMDLYGDLGRGLNVTTTVSDTTAAGALEIRIQYLFLDAGVIGLPFVSVITESTTDPAPVVDTANTESLVLVTETI